MAEGGLAGLMGAYGTDEEGSEMEEEAGGQVTILGRSDEDEDMQGADLSHLTTAAARVEPDTAATQPAAVVAGPAPPPGSQPAGPGDGAAAGEGAAGAAEDGGGDGAADAGVGGSPGTAAAAASLLPPELLEPPPGECDPALQQKVATWLNVQRARGRYINTELRHSRGYRNPEFFRKMVEHLEIDEYGSSFAPEVFDPHSLPKEDYIEELQKEWAAEEERRKAQRAATGRIEFTKSASQPSLAHNPLMPGLNPAAALAAAQIKAAQLAAAGVAAAAAAAAAGAQGAGGGGGAGAPGGGKGGKWDMPRR